MAVTLVVLSVDLKLNQSIFQAMSKVTTRAQLHLLTGKVHNDNKVLTPNQQTGSYVHTLSLHCTNHPLSESEECNVIMDNHKVTLA